ncbi:MAG: type II toxin-antitoxin system VapC family toxin [Candidatus Binataceae bacterium]|jgi:predicted nucleic acid-binding protein
MAGYLLDTSVIVDVLNGKRERKPMLEILLQQGNTLGCCAINVAEVYAGMRPHEAQATQALLKSLDYYEITWEIARKAGEIKFQQARRGRTLSLADAMIAAVTVSNQLKLMTDNVRHYQIPGVNLFPLD